MCSGAESHATQVSGRGCAEPRDAADTPGPAPPHGLPPLRSRRAASGALSPGFPATQDTDAGCRPQATRAPGYISSAAGGSRMKNRNWLGGEVGPAPPPPSFRGPPRGPGLCVLF